MSATTILNASDVDDALGALDGLRTILYRFVELHPHEDQELVDRLEGIDDDSYFWSHRSTSARAYWMDAFARVTALRERLLTSYGASQLEDGRQS